jgi:tetratricopeptide (TPR) repeat protein
MNTYNQLYFLSFNTGASYKALDYANKALKIAQENNYTKSIGIIYSNMALMYIKLGDYEKANEYNYRGLDIFKEIKDTMQIARCKLSIGSVYFMLNDHAKALTNISAARDDFLKVNDEKGYSICLTNIGLIYIHRAEYKMALRHFFEAVQIDEKNHDLDGISSNFINIGEVYFRLGNNERALEYYNQAYEIDSKTDDKSGMGSLYLKLAKISMSENNLDEAMDYCKKSIRIFDETTEPNSKKDALEQLAKVYQKLGNYKKAYTLFKEATQLKDSLFNMDKAAKIAMLEEKYLNEKLSNENLNLKYANEIQQTKITGQRKLNQTYLLALLILIVAMAIIVVQLRKKNLAYKFITRKNLDLIKKEQELKSTKEKMNAIAEINKSKISLSSSEKEEILSKLEKLMEKEKIYTRTDLTIDKLARRLTTNRTYLSQIINDDFGKSYSNFINEYRVKEAIKMFSDSEKGKKYSIDAIAREAGFNTISNFNMVFKKITGVTPSVFVKNIDYQSVTPNFNTTKYTKL